MSDIDLILGFSDEDFEVENTVLNFVRIWRLAIVGMNCARPPQVQISSGVVLPCAFDLREATDRKEEEKSLSFIKLKNDTDNLYTDEKTHMELMATSYRKGNKDALRANRCSITIEKEKILSIAESDPQNKVLLSDFKFEESRNGERTSNFSEAKGNHWDGYFLSDDENKIIMIKSTLSKCAKIITNNNQA